MTNSPPTPNPAPAGWHPSVATWIAYYARKVPESEASGLRKHLARCRRCIDLVLDLDRFAEPSPRIGAVADFEQAAVWRTVKAAVEPRARVGHWPTVAAVAASTVFAVVGLAQYNARVDLETQIAERSGLQPNVVIESLRPGARERSAGGVDATAELSAAGGPTALILNLKDEVDFPAYELRVFDGEGGEVERIPGLTISDFGNFSLAVPPGALAAGRYELRLFGLDADAEQLIETYPIHLR
jgi:hypothetical protein